MIEMVKSERPVDHTFHRAWTACVGLPKYHKRPWMQLEKAVLQAEETRDPAAIGSVLRAIENLLHAQGGTYTP